MSDKVKILTVVFANTWRTTVAVVHENQELPYSFRTVRVELTDEQMKALEPRVVGQDGTIDVYEDIYNSWLEGK